MKKNTILALIAVFFAAALAVFFFWMQSQKTEKKLPNTVVPKEHSVVQFETPESQQKTKELSQDEIFQMASRAFENGNLSEALQNANFYTEKNPNSVEGLQLVRDISIARLNFSESLAASEKLLALQPQNIAFLQKHAEIYMLQNDLGNAKSTLQKLPADDAKRMFFEGIILMAEGNETGGKNIFSSLSGTAEYTETAKKFLSIFDEFALFKDGNPNHKKAMIGSVFNALQFHQIAIGYLLPVLREMPEYRDPWILVGHSYFATKQFYPQALNALEKAVSLDPSHPKSVYFLGLTLAELERYDDAIAQLENASKNGFSPSWEVQKQLADVFLRKEDFSSANNAFEKFLSENPKLEMEDFAKPIHIAIENLKNPDLALSRAVSASQKFPENPLAFAFLGWALLEKNDLEKAEKAFQKSFSLKADFAAAHYYQGLLREKQNQSQMALEEYKKAYAADRGGIYGSEAAKRHNELLEELQHKND